MKRQMTNQHKIRSYRLCYVVILMVAMCPLVLHSQVSLDSCRRMALRANKQVLIADEQVRQAGYKVREARAAYLPALDMTGSYVYNSREISIFDSDQLLPTKSFNASMGSYDFNLVTDPTTGLPMKTPDGKYIPSTVALIPKESMTYNIHHVFAGAVTLTQPVYMGGKIMALNKIARYAEQIAVDLKENSRHNVVYDVDVAYWQVVSLEAKSQLAQSYVALLDTLYRNVSIMKREGFVTKSDVLSVAVKLNSANVDLVKVQNGLSLARMDLNRLCGLPIDNVMVLEDVIGRVGEPELCANSIDMPSVYESRSDIRALRTAVKVAEQQQRVALSSMLPNIALVGGYSFTNPNMFNGFNRRFDGMFSVGVMVTVPIWHWGGNYNKYRAAKSSAVIQRLELEDAMEKVELQVNQAIYKMNESIKTQEMTESNLEKADENLRQAEMAMKEGVMTVENVMEAQTAWLKAYSESIDADIDVRLCRVYLQKVSGTMNY